VTPAATLRSTAEIRARSQLLLTRARAGGSDWFTVHDDAMAAAAAEVAALTAARFPDLVIPFHSRWRHFEAGGVDRKSALDGLLGDLDGAGRARAMIDLTVVSVLLDAGAGPDWSYRDADTGRSSPARRDSGSPASAPSPPACSPPTRRVRCRPTPPA
jgi:hypothetical protein